MLAAMLGGCDSMPGRPTEAEMPLRPSAITDFAQLYGENCAGCHGVDGKLGPATAFNNPVYLSIVDDASMHRVIANGTPGTAMPPFARSQGGTLTDQQIDLIIAGVRKVWSGDKTAGDGAPRYSSDSAGNSGRGARVYEGNCESCHGADGKGGSAGSIVDASFLALVSDQNLRTTVIAGRADIGHPDWKGYPSGKPLSPQQVADVVAWMASKRAPSPLNVSSVAIH
jgi:cytochrome c oxidase cbb3-type subunit 3/ubiquinol-cytochrome c reductase cytochrome c subunit